MVDPHRIATLLDGIRCEAVTYISKTNPRSYEGATVVFGCGHCRLCRTAKELSEMFDELFAENDELRAKLDESDG